MKPRSRQIWFTILAAVLAVNLVIGYRVYSRESIREGEAEALQKISVMMRVLHLIQKDYVNPDKIDYESLLYNAIDGMVSSLDPYSSFLEPDDFHNMMETTEGEFGGIGIVVTIRNGRLSVVTPIEGTPGSRAGLLAGDQIIEIDGELVEDATLTEAIKKLKGEPGTIVKIKVFRPETEETRSFEIERAIIEVPSVKGAQVIEDGLSYVRLTQFDEGTSAALEAALAELSERGMTSLVMDLRNNTGGLLTSAVDVAALFLEPGELVVSTEGRRASQKREYHTPKGKKYLDLPMVILVNKGSASAAEIVSGCLQDSKRAILIGEKTFGKGSVQNVIKLSDGSALRLTTAMYYTPSHRVIHENGIEPDITVKMTSEQLRALVERQMEVNGGGAVDPTNDPPLARALETLKSYEVFRSAAD